MKAQEALEKAQQIIMDYNHSELKTTHLLLALLLQDDSLVEVVLDKMNINKEDIINELDKRLGEIPKVVVERGEFGQVLLSPEVITVFEKAERFCKEEKNDFISVEHLFMALIDVRNEVKDLLVEFNIKLEEFKKVLIEARKTVSVDSEKGSASYKILEKYSDNLTERARLDKLDPLIGREDELERIMQILSRRMKNNPVLLGEPGVGKTAIIEGLAQKIIKKEVPENLKNKEILSLDIGAMIAGTKFRGEFEERLKNVLKEIKANEDKYIIFVDELQTIVGAGASEGSIDASNLLKPALSRGEIRLIGATTYRDYRDSIEKDPALERRFQPVTIDEPTIEDAITILRGLKNKYEVFHGIKISDDAIKAAVNLSSRYIPERFLPDKAIDLVDEASSNLKLQMNSTPSEIAFIQKRIRVLEIEYEAIKKEEGESFKKRVKEIKHELKHLKEEEKKLIDKWNIEKSSITDIHELKKQINNLEREAEKFENEGDLGKVAEIIYGQIPMIEKNIKKMEKLAKKKVKAQFVKEEIDASDISKVIAK
jgi:ATP-dependent Clp protease ATP-binding subunit ClpB